MTILTACSIMLNNVNARLIIHHDKGWEDLLRSFEKVKEWFGIVKYVELCKICGAL